MRHKRLILLALGLALLAIVSLSSTVYADSWISPTSNGSFWGNQDNWKAYDDNLATYAHTSGVSYLSLWHNESAINCDRVRLHGADDLCGLTIDVYYGNAWHNILNDEEIADNQWVELPIGSTEMVSGARIKQGGGICSVYFLDEFDFYQVNTAGATIIDYLPFVLGIAIFAGIFAGIRFRNPLVIVGVVVVTSLMGFAAIMIIQAFQGSEVLFW